MSSAPAGICWNLIFWRCEFEVQPHQSLYRAGYLKLGTPQAFTHGEIEGFDLKSNMRVNEQEYWDVWLNAADGRELIIAKKGAWPRFGAAVWRRGLATRIGQAVFGEISSKR